MKAECWWGQQEHNHEAIKIIKVQKQHSSIDLLAVSEQTPVLSTNLEFQCDKRKANNTFIFYINKYLFRFVLFTYFSYLYNVHIFHATFISWHFPSIVNCFHSFILFCSITLHKLISNFHFQFHTFLLVGLVIVGLSHE